MIKLINRRTTFAALAASLVLTGCARFDQRMQANGNFDYQKVKLNQPYQTGQLSNDELRSQFDVPRLTDPQKASGALTKDVDIRPPTQLIPVIDGVFLTANKEQTKILFNALEQGDIETKVWQLLNAYLAENKIEIASKDSATGQIETALYSQNKQYGSFLNHNDISKTAKYHFSLDKKSGHSAELSVNLLDYSELNNGEASQFKMTEQYKKDVELRFVNDLLVFAYYEKEALEQHNQDRDPLLIKLGFDENHQTSWLVESSFSETWRKLPELLSLLNFEVLDADKNLGLYSVNFSTPSDDYWEENNLKPFDLDYGPYFVQLGEVDKQNSSISWLGAKKKPLTDKQVTDLYLSISERIRSALLKKDKQTKSL